MLNFQNMVKRSYTNKNDMPFILEELKRGNERAFDMIFQQYYNSLCQFAFSFTNDQNTAESLVQEIFIKLWEKRESIATVDNILSYLIGMVRNQSIDFLRKEKSKSKIYANLQIESSGNTTEEQILKNEFEESLLKAITNLPERCRTAFEMSRFEGLSNKEIALEMKISVKGVEALIGRSLKLLRTDLQEFLPSFSEKNSKGNTILFSLFIERLKRYRLPVFNS